MGQSQLNWITGYIWGIADDVLRHLRDTEQIPLTENGGIEAFLRHTMLPHAPAAWYVLNSVKTGYATSFTRYCYKPQPMRTLEEIRDDILALTKETEEFLEEIIEKAN